MNRPNPIEYAERLYAAIRAANFSPISFLAFGNAIKDGVDLRRMPRIAAEPFMRVVGEMLEREEAETPQRMLDAEVADALSAAAPVDEVSDSTEPNATNIGDAVESKAEGGAGG